jgi:transposase, IS5 family
VRLEPLLQAIGDFLDKQPALVEQVRRDLVRGLRQPDHGRHGLTAVQVLRADAPEELGLSRRRGR